MKRIILILLVLTTNLSFAQKSDFPEWGKFSNYEKNLTVYEKDNSAHAVVLDEVGYAYVESGGDYNIILKVYRKIKILDKEGVNQANIRKKIYKKNELKKIVGTTTNFVNGKAVVTKLSKSQVFTEKVSEDYKTVTFTLPNVKVGSIIEYSYKIRTPFHHTFAGGWTFQNSIPTLKSSYFAKIPGFWNYHISTKGISNPQFQQNTLIKDCISVNSTVAECLFLELSLYDIPAFIKEDFATSSDNFLKQIKFELRTFTDATGTVIHFNKEWKDTDKRLFRDQQFGRQFNDLRFIKKHLPPKIFEEQDPLSKAKKVYTFIQNNFRWNHQNKLFWEFNTKKAYETKEGSMVEINLSLIQALKAAGISTDIALLSTRDNGFVTKIHPAISDFNYLVAHIKIKGVDYFLDATDKKLPFGFLPYKCLNGDIRIFNTNKASYWFPYTPKSKNETLVYALGQINEDGSVEMKTRYIYNGYTAIEKREEMLEESVETYKKDLIDQLEDFEIVEHTIEQLDQTEKPLIETLEVTYDSDFLNDDNIYFKPFIIKRFKTNPFTLKERQYPVDLGYKRNFMYNLTFHIPEVYTVKSLPKNRKIILPDNGGELVYLLTETENKIMIKFSFSLDKTQYLPQEYNYLKEMFSQLILAQNEMVILEKNK